MLAKWLATFTVEIQVQSFLWTLRMCATSLFDLSSSQRWWSLHLHPSWAWWRQVWLWTCIRTLAPCTHCRDNPDECHFYDFWSKWWVSCKCGCCSKLVCIVWVWWSALKQPKQTHPGFVIIIIIIGIKTNFNDCICRFDN